MFCFHLQQITKFPQLSFSSFRTLGAKEIQDLGIPLRFARELVLLAARRGSGSVPPPPAPAPAAVLVPAPAAAGVGSGRSPLAPPAPAAPAAPAAPGPPRLKRELRGQLQPSDVKLPGEDIETT